MIYVGRGERGIRGEGGGGREEGGRGGRGGGGGRRGRQWETCIVALGCLQELKKEGGNEGRERERGRE